MIKLVYLVVMISTGNGGGVATVPAPFTGAEAWENCQEQAKQFGSGFPSGTYCVIVTRDPNADHVGREY